MSSVRQNGTRLTNHIKLRTRESRIDVVRFTHAGPFEGYPLPGFLRRDPHGVISTARSLIVFGVYIGGYRLAGWEDPSTGRTSRLFLSGFYSDVVTPLESIRSYLHGQGFSAVICDSLQSGSSVLPLKLAAVRAGIGWQGKNTLLISPEHGSFLALGGIITDAPLEEDNEPQSDRCGSCRACQEACPTNALAEPYRLNRERCLASRYKDKALPWEFYQVMGNRVIECEICQAVCPWNRKHVREPLMGERTHRFAERSSEVRELFTLSNLFRLSEPEYEDFIRPYRTDISYLIFRRNVVIALGNSQSPDALPLLRSAARYAYPEVCTAAKAYLEHQ